MTTSLNRKVGFAAAIVHRGVRLLRVPTTSLAQCDAGIGVKNGINARGQKNLIGTFAPPHAVINRQIATMPNGIRELIKTRRFICPPTKGSLERPLPYEGPPRRNYSLEEGGCPAALPQ